MFRKILAATDRIPVQDAPVLAAMCIAEQNHAKLHIIHVLESASTKNRDIVKHYRSGEEMISGATYQSAVRSEIAKNYAERFSKDDDYEIKIATGFPWLEIARYAREIDADLVVIGPHSKQAQEKGVIRVVGKIGSTVEGVIKREHCPVMIVNEMSVSNMPSFCRILIGIDFSKSCECALAFAAKLSNTCGAKLFVFHMIPVPPFPKYTRDDYAADVEATTKRLESFCEPFVEKTKYEYGVLGGALPHIEILKWAEKQSVDAIVMGSHTKEEQGKWYPGNAVERVSFRSRCPTIVITDPAALQPWDDVLPEERQEDPGMNRSIHIFESKKS